MKTKLVMFCSIILNLKAPYSAQHFCTKLQYFPNQDWNQSSKLVFMNLNLQGVPSISRHFCRPVARPVSTQSRRSASQIKRTLQDFRTRGWVTRSDNFGARYERFSKKCTFWVILERIQEFQRILPQKFDIFWSLSRLLRFCIRTWVKIRSIF